MQLASIAIENYKLIIPILTLLMLTIKPLRQFNGFKLDLSTNGKIILTILSVLYLSLIAWTVNDVFIVKTVDKTASLISQFSIWKVCNLILWIILIILVKGREKTTYHNYAYIGIGLIAMFVSNNFLFSHYSDVYFAKAGYMICLLGFFVALPLHEKQKENR